MRPALVVKVGLGDGDARRVLVARDLDSQPLALRLPVQIKGDVGVDETDAARGAVRQRVGDIDRQGAAPERRHLFAGYQVPRRPQPDPARLSSAAARDDWFAAVRLYLPEGRDEGRTGRTEGSRRRH